MSFWTVLLLLGLEACKASMAICVYAGVDFIGSNEEFMLTALARPTL
jgi:hypothetical protein